MNDFMSWWLNDISIWVAVVFILILLVVGTTGFAWYGELDGDACLVMTMASVIICPVAALLPILFPLGVLVGVGFLYAKLVTKWGENHRTVKKQKAIDLKDLIESDEYIKKVCDRL